MRRILLCLLATIFFTCPILHANEVELQRIVVTPSRVEQDYSESLRQVDIITSEDIASSQATDLSGVLKGFAAINMADYGGPGATKTLRMRGSSAAQVIVLMDGRPYNSPRDGEVDFSAIPLDNIERIEIMRGPASSLYGSSAMGGVVNIITKDAPLSGHKTDITTSFGSWRTYTGAVTHGARVSDFGYLVSAGYQTSEGFRDNSEFDAKDASAKFTYQLNPDNSLTLNNAFYISKAGTPGPLGSFDPDDKQVRSNYFTDLLWKGALAGGFDILARVYRAHDRLEFSENAIPTAWDTALDKFIHTSIVEGLDFQISKVFGDSLTSVLGVNYVSNRNDSTSTAKHEYLVRAWYLNNNWDVTDFLMLNLGARVDDYSNFGSETSPSAGFLLKITPQNRLRALFSRSFRAPTFNDLFWPDQGWAVGNPLLKPEKGTTWETGFTSEIAPWITCDLAYYRSKYSDLINWAPDVTGWIWSPTNVNSAIIHGVEFTTGIKVKNDWGIDISYAFLRAKDRDTRLYLVYQPKHRANCTLSYKGFNGLLLELKANFTDNRFHNAANTIKVERFVDVGFTARKKIREDYSCFVSINNLLNRQYQVNSDYPAPGFGITGGIKIEL